VRGWGGFAASGQSLAARRRGIGEQRRVLAEEQTRITTSAAPAIRIDHDHYQTRTQKMGLMIDGEWKYKGDWESDEGGRFQRQDTTFREWVTQDDSTPYDPEAGRYHLYVSYACPWAHRTLAVRALQGLEDAIDVSVVDPFMGKDGWQFSPDKDGATRDKVHDSDYLREVYKEARQDFTGRVTVPVLWDKKTETIVNNESAEIIRMFDTVFDEVATNDEWELYPSDRADRIDEVIEAIYQPINNGVYRAGFAETQEAYDEAIDELFGALSHWDDVLGEHRYLCGDRVTEADICMFTTLFRFDHVYHTHFKCNVREIQDYPNLSGYVRDIYQLPGIADVSRLDHITHHYYRSHEHINPNRIEARGPDIDFDAPHGRGT
jgi:putative glutathione S-transferase